MVSSSSCLVLWLRVATPRTPWYILVFIEPFGELCRLRSFSTPLFWLCITSPPSAWHHPLHSRSGAQKRLRFHAGKFFEDANQGGTIFLRFSDEQRPPDDRSPKIRNPRQTSDARNPSRMATEPAALACRVNCVSLPSTDGHCVLQIGRTFPYLPIC